MKDIIKIPMFENLLDSIYHAWVNNPEAANYTVAVFQRGKETLKKGEYLLQEQEMSPEFVGYINAFYEDDDDESENEDATYIMIDGNRYSSDNYNSRKEFLDAVLVKLYNKLISEYKTKLIDQGYEYEE